MAQQTQNFFKARVIGHRGSEEIVEAVFDEDRLSAYIEDLKADKNATIRIIGREIESITNDLRFSNITEDEASLLLDKLLPRLEAANRKLISVLNRSKR